MTPRHSKIRPALAPNEEWRAALKARIVSEATPSGPTGADNAGSRDFTGDQPLDHVMHMYDPHLGVTITAADIEPINTEHALTVARHVHNLVAAARRQHHDA